MAGGQKGSGGLAAAAERTTKVVVFNGFGADFFFDVVGR